MRDDKEEKLVRMMGSKLMITMFKPNDEIQKKEINTARELNIPILFIYNSKEEKESDSVNKEDKIIFKEDFKRIEMKLKNKFKLIKKIKKRQGLPFGTVENKTKLFKFTNINSLSILKEEEKEKFISTGDQIQSFNLDLSLFIRLLGVNIESILPIKILNKFKFNEGQLLACVDSTAKEIIVLNNKVFSKYNFKFEKKPEVKTLQLKDDVVIDVIVVNEENKHLYAISNNYGCLLHFDNEFTFIKQIKVTIPLLIKVFNNHLYLLLNGYGNANIEGEETSHLLEDERSFITVYSQKEDEEIKFNKKIILNHLINPSDFHIEEKYILIFTRFINQMHLGNDIYSHLFLFNHDGILLQKTRLDILGHLDTRYLVVDFKTIYCANYLEKTFYRLEFN